MNEKLVSIVILNMSGSVLFSPIQIGPLKLKNRIMRSPCVMNDSDNNGFPSNRLLSYYKELAIGEMGLITSGGVYATKAGKNCTQMAGIETDQHAEAWRSTIDFIHSKGSKFIFQLADSGEATTSDISCSQPRGPSGLLPNSRMMSTAEVEEFIEIFINAANRAQNVGSDGVCVHAAHGFMISEFLSPHYNKRTDKYGGSPENNRRILKEIVEGIRSRCGKDFLIATKINGADQCENGITAKDFVQNVLNTPGLDMVEVSCGFQNDAGCRTPSFKGINGIRFKPGYNLDEALELRKISDIPIAVVGGFRKLKDMEEAVKKGIQLISLGRPSICELHIVKHLIEGHGSKCISCNQCVNALATGMAKCCVF